MNNAKWRKAYSSDRAANYDEFIKVGAGPIYENMLDSIVQTIDLFCGRKPLRVLDLGSGTGNVSKHLLQFRQAIQITCLDGSAHMLEMARRRFQNDPKFTFVERDFSAPDWAHGLGLFDVIYSVGALHHLDSAGKRSIFGQIFQQLCLGGLFICGDPLKGITPELDDIYEEAWVRTIQRNIKNLHNKDMDIEEIRREHRRVQEAEGDRPSSLRDQISWLSLAGLTHVECFWKSFGFAVFGGVRR